MANKAAYLPAVGASLEVKEAPIAKPGAGEVLIENRAFAINPIDYKQQESGAMITSFPYVSKPTIHKLRMTNKNIMIDPRDGPLRSRGRGRRRC
jgi:hypothetical protein